MPDTERSLWDGMLAQLRSSHASICRQWFDQLEPLGVRANTLHLRTQSVVHRDYLRRNCLESFNDAARTTTGTLLSVRFLGPEDAPEGEDQVHTASTPGADRPGVGVRAKPGRAAGHAAAPPAEPRNTPSPEAGGPGRGEPARLREVKQAPAVRSDDGLVLNPDYAFASFVKGPQNRLACAAAQAVADQPGQAYNPLFIHGGVGLGKTHLLQAICLHIFERNRHANIYYISCEGFMTQFMEAVQAGRMSEFRHRFRDVDVLIVDDIHFLAKGDSSQEEFFHTFNALQQARKQIVLSSDARPEDIPHLEERLVSRFKWGVVTPIEKPCMETRAEIVRRKAALHQYEVPDEVAKFIAERVDTNIRELEGALSTLAAHARFSARAIDMDLAREMLGEAEPKGPSAAVSLESIVSAVTDFYSVRLSDLQSKRRQRSIALPRQICMWLARELTNHSLEEVGGFFGGRDHTTVMHAVKTVTDKSALDPEFAQVLTTLLDRSRR